MSVKSSDVLPQADDIQDMIEVNRDAMKTAWHSYNEWLANSCRIQTEILSFINKRVREDIDLPRQFADSKSPAEIVEHQMSFTQRMLTDYADESIRIMGLLSDKPDENGSKAAHGQ